MDDIENIKESTAKKPKKFFTLIICLILGLAIAAGGIFCFYFFVDGASSPEAAVTEYTKAGLLYDVDGMIKYSSYYNKVYLSRQKETSDRLLRDYLTKTYETATVNYQKSEISFEHISTDIYEAGSNKFAEVIEKYSERADSTKIKKIALVRVNVITKDKKNTRTLVAIKEGMRWYYAFGQ